VFQNLLPVLKIYSLRYVHWAAFKNFTRLRQVFYPCFTSNEQ